MIGGAGPPGRGDEGPVPSPAHCPALSLAGVIGELPHHLLNHAVRPLPHLVGGQILHGMRHADDGKPRHAEGLCLDTRGVEKDLRR